MRWSGVSTPAGGTDFSKIVPDIAGGGVSGSDTGSRKA
jgi:hypothetical protein